MNLSSKEEFSFVEPRDTVEIHLPDKRVICGPRGAPVGEFLKLLQSPQTTRPTEAPVVGAVVNGELRELIYPVRMDSRVSPITMSDEDGMLFYRRALTFLLEAAFEELFPDATLTIDHSVSSGGYYCRVSDPLIMTEAELKRLEAQMRLLVAEDLPFIRREVPLPEAIAYFTAKGYDDKVRLLSHRQKDYLVLYRLGDHQDYLHGYMVPSTGFLKWFGLALTNGGFTLLFPRRHSPTTVASTPSYPKLLQTFHEWMREYPLCEVSCSLFQFCCISNLYAWSAGVVNNDRF